MAQKSVLYLDTIANMKDILDCHRFYILTTVFKLVLILANSNASGTRVFDVVCKNKTTIGANLPFGSLAFALAVLLPLLLTLSLAQFFQIQRNVQLGNTKKEIHHNHRHLMLLYY